MNHQKILLIGGPGTGKTTLLKGLENKNYICYPEISREVTKKAQEEGIDQLFLENPLLFSKMLLEGRINQYESAEKQKGLVFIDRGIPDVIAYMDFVGDSYPHFFIEACHKYKYDHIFYLPPWKKIYISDNERYESFEQAVEIDKFLKNTYLKFGYKPIEVPKDSVDNRILFIESYL